MQRLLARLCKGYPLATPLSEEVLYGRLVVTDPARRAFVLLGLDEVFVAPDGVDLALLDGMLVRVDFDDGCNVRTVVPAEVLAGPMIET